MKKWIAAVAVMVAVSSVAGALAAGSATPYVGSWKARMTKAQLIDQGLVDPRAVGVWRLVLKRDGTYRAFNPLDGWTNGQFSATDRRMTFKKDPACLDAGFIGVGKYRWSVKDRKLKLTAVFPGSDPCGGRWHTLSFPLWTRA